MPEKPAAYHVTLTAVRHYKPGSGPPEKPDIWNFSQMVWSTKGYSGALVEMLNKFFEWYPDNGVILPNGKRDNVVLTPENRGRASGYLKGKPQHESGNYRLENDDAILHVNKMRALSGETPQRLTPKSDKEYSDALQKNIQSIDPYYESVVQMPSPIRGSSEVPKYIKLNGCLYRQAAELFEDATLEDSIGVFNEQMEEVTKELVQISEMLMDAGEKLREGDTTFPEVIQEAAVRVYKILMEEVLVARDMARSIRAKMPKKQMVAKTLQYKGATYELVAQPHKGKPDVREEQQEELSTGEQVADSHLRAVISDARAVQKRAHELMHSLHNMGKQARICMERDGEISPEHVDVMQSDKRIEELYAPMRSMEKSNRQLNYTVDAAISSMKGVVHQLDAMVDEWHAARDTMNAPNTSRELTEPMLLSDNPSAVFDELGGL